MKHLKFTIILSVFALVASQAQGLKGAATLGVPVGNAGDTHGFSIAVDASYLIEVEENILAGPMIGYSHSFGKDFTIPGTNITAEQDDRQFVPIGASGRFTLTETLFVGADLGYAIGIDDGNDGGFYYAPKAGFSLNDTIDIIAVYRGVAVSGGSFNIFSAGVEFNL